MYGLFGSLSLMLLERNVRKIICSINKELFQLLFEWWFGNISNRSETLIIIVWNDYKTNYKKRTTPAWLLVNIKSEDWIIL